MFLSPWLLFLLISMFQFFSDPGRSFIVVSVLLLGFRLSIQFVPFKVVFKRTYSAILSLMSFLVSLVAVRHTGVCFTGLPGRLCMFVDRVSCCHGACSFLCSVFPAPSRWVL